jgi:hypothetical protein
MMLAYNTVPLLLMTGNRTQTVVDSTARNFYNRNMTLILDREICLSALEAALAEVFAGTGRIALIGGDAGIGKTTLKVKKKLGETHGTHRIEIYHPCLRR